MNKTTWMWAIVAAALLVGGCSQTKTALQQMNRKLVIERDGLVRQKTQLNHSLKACRADVEGKREVIDTLKEQLTEIQAEKAVQVEAVDEAAVKRQEFKAKMASALADKDCELVGRGNDLVIRANVGIVSGSTQIDKSGQTLLRAIVDAIRKNAPGHDIRVEGHTDNAPISAAKFASNWELSGARAVSVLRFLIDRCGVAPERISFAGYGEFAPVAPNIDAKSKARNRRIEIVLIADE